MLQGGSLGVIWIVLVALVAAGLGFRSSWRAIGRLRAPASVEGAFLWWDERPVPAFQQDPVAASFVAVHGAAIVAMGVLAVLIGGRALTAPPAWMPPAGAWSLPEPIWLIHYAGVSLSAGLAWLTAGSALAIPLASRRWSPVRVALTEEGVYHGGTFTPWGMAGRAQRGGRGELIRLYSRKTPELVLLAVRPPAPELLERACQAIEARIPPLPEDYRVPWYRRMPVLCLLLLMTALPMVALGLAAYPSTATWAWASQGFGAWLAALLGARVVRAYQ